jgi:carbamate kinase
MLPQIEAALDYLETKKAGKVIITSIAKAADGLKGKTGTVIFS